MTIPLAQVLNTWVDESYTLRTTSRTLAYAIEQAVHFELQPPLYFALLQVWREASHSIFFARLFSVVCMALTLYCAAGIARRYIPAINPTWVVTALAVNPAVVWAALEIRVYAFAALLSALLLVTFYDGFLRAQPSRIAQISHTLIAIAALYTQYFLGFILAGLLVSAVISRRWGAFRAYVILLFIVSACSVPLIMVLREQVAVGTATYFSDDTLQQVFLRFYETWLGYALPVAWLAKISPFLGSIKLWVALGASLTVSLAYLGRRTLNDNAKDVLTTVFLVTGALLVVALYITKEPYGPRYAFIVFLPLMLAFLATLASLAQRYRTVPRVWFTLFVLCALVTYIFTYGHLAKGGDWKRVAEFIQSSERPGQPILAFQTENALSLEDYYKGRNQIVAVPRPIRFDTAWNENVVVRTEYEISQDLTNVPGKHALVWAVTTKECRDFSVDYHCPIFEHYVSSNFRVRLRREFFGSTVRLLEAKH